MKIDYFVKKTYWRFIPPNDSRPEEETDEYYIYDQSDDDDYKIIKYLCSKQEKKKNYQKIKKRLLRNMRQRSVLISEIINAKITIRNLIDYVRFSLESYRETK